MIFEIYRSISQVVPVQHPQSDQLKNLLMSWLSNPAERAVLQKYMTSKFDGSEAANPLLAQFSVARWIAFLEKQTLGEASRIVPEWLRLVQPATPENPIVIGLTGALRPHFIEMRRLHSL